MSVRDRINVLANRQFVLELSLECERLNALDDLWTTYLDDPDNEFELQHNLPALHSLVGEMVSLLSSISNKSRELDLLIREFGSDLDSELEQLLAEHPARDALLERRPPMPLASTVIDACAVVQADTPAAIVELAEKLKRIADGEFQAGDIPRRLKCAIVLAGAGAGILAACATPGALIVLPAAVVAGSGIVGGVSTALAAFGWGCQPTPPPGVQPT